MKLFFKKTGEGKPLIILHGLFGMSDNWATLSKAFAEAGFGCYLVDQRNHGRSPHSEDFNFQIMAQDIFELMNEEKMPPVHPGEILLEDFMKPSGITQYRLAKAMNVLLTIWLLTTIGLLLLIPKCVFV